MFPRDEQPFAAFAGGSSRTQSGNLHLSRGAFDKIAIGPLQPIVLPFAVETRSTIQLIGTCFVIGSSGLMITARHVFEEAQLILQSEPEAYAVVILVDPEGDRLKPREHFAVTVQVRDVYTIDNHDVALFRIDSELPDGTRVELPRMSLTVGLPRPGSPILGLGYTRMTLEYQRWSGIRRFVSLAQTFHGSHGVVTDTYPRGRDSVMLPFPCVATSARFDSGMSGGPVFDGATGNVFGVVCSGLDQEPGEETYTSTAALMVCALGLAAEQNAAGDVSATLYDLMERGTIGKCDQFERVLVRRSGSNIETTYNFDY